MRRNMLWWGVGIAGLLLGVSPVAYVVLQWLYPEPEIFSHFATYRLSLTAGNTLILMALVALFSALMGAGSAFILHYYPPYLPGAFRLLHLLPLSLPAYVSAFVYLGLMRGGFGGSVALIGQQMLGAWAAPVGASLVLSLCFYPYVFLMTYQSLRRGSRDLFEAGLSLGRGFGEFVMRVLLPRSWPWIFGGILLVLMEVLADFGAVSVLGVDTLTTEVYKAWHGFFSFAGAAQIATLPLVLVVLLLALDGWLHKRRSQQDLLQSYEREVLPRSLRRRSRVISTALLGALAFFSVGLPIFQLFLWVASSPEALYQKSNWFGFFQSLTIGVLAGALVVFLVLALTLAHRYTGSRALAFMDKIASLCYALPGPVLALGLLGCVHFLNLSSIGAYLLVLGLALRFLVVGGQPIRGDFLKLPKAFDEVAESLGQPRKKVMGKIYAPVIRSGVVMGFLVASIESFKEMPLTLMLRPFGWEPLSVQIFSLTTEGEYERAALPALLLVVLSVVSLTVVWWQQDKNQDSVHAQS